MTSVVLAARRLQVVLECLAILMLGLAGAPSRAATLDQSYSYKTGVAGGAQGWGFLLGGSAGFDQMVAESFTVGLSGQLTNVYAQIDRDAGSISGALTLAVRSSLTGPALASGSVQARDIPLGVSFVGVDIFASRLFVTPGQVLYLIVSSTNSYDTLAAAAAVTDDPAIAADHLYPGGAAYVYNLVVDPGGRWGPVSDATYADFGFQTYVTPLPAALPAFAGGLVALGLFARRRKRVAAAAA